MNREPQMGVIDCWGRIGVLGDRSCPDLVEYDHCHNCPVYAKAGRSLFDREQPDDYIEAASRLIEFEKNPSIQKPSSVVIFRLGHEKLALSTQAFHQVYDMQPRHKIPHMRSPVVMGLVNLSGDLHLCISLAKLLEIDQGSEDGFQVGRSVYSRIAVIVHNNERWAFPANEILGVHRYAASLIQAPPSTVSKSSKPYTQGLIKFDGEHVGVLDEARLFEALKRSVY
ncbi:MAG: chemotaxis protein CheW [Candidatus Hinthialibacter antarcticus]|nr:chemotaxis protein CheW [Candidatus Hinthialibacter antarcticus]